MGCGIYKYGEQNALNPMWMKELEMHQQGLYSRLEVLRITQTIEKLFGGQVDEVDAA